MECMGIPLNATAFRGMVRCHYDMNAAAQEFGFRKRQSAAVWTASAMCTIPPATAGAAESPHVPTGMDAWQHCTCARNVAARQARATEKRHARRETKKTTE